MYKHNDVVAISCDLLPVFGQILHLIMVNVN